MIVVDTSALIAIARDEPDAERCMLALHSAQRVMISAPTVTETLVVAHNYQCVGAIEAILDRFGLVVEPVTEIRARAAADAYRRYGKRQHAADLNYGDSFAYALARELDCPLLYIGNDFALTDITSALA